MKQRLVDKSTRTEMLTTGTSAPEVQPLHRPAHFNQDAAGDGRKRYVYTTDHLGSIREVLLLDGTSGNPTTATPTARYDYDLWGKRTVLLCPSSSLLSRGFGLVTSAAFCHFFTESMPEDDDLHQPHDKLFVQGFSDPVNAAAFLRTQVPAAIAARIDWSALVLQNGSFIDSKFRKTQTDLLFATTFSGKPCRFHLLFEHQSSPDPLMPLRLLIYKTRIWEAFLKEHPGERLPVVFSFVLAQNASRWEVAQQFSSLLDLPEEEAELLRPFIPDFTFGLMQLAEMPFQSLPGTPAGVLILRVLKAERIDQLLNDAVWDESLITQVSGPLFEFLLLYILAADIDKDQFMTRVRNIQNPSTRENAMSLAQQLRLEGRREGRQEGRQEGEASMVIRLLRKKFPEIAEAASTRVLQLNEEHLVAFGEALLFMQTSEDCLTWLREHGQ